MTKTTTYPVDAVTTSYFASYVFQKRMPTGDLAERLRVVVWTVQGSDPLTKNEIWEKAVELIGAEWPEVNDGPMAGWTKTMWDGKFVVHFPPGARRAENR